MTMRRYFFHMLLCMGVGLCMACNGAQADKAKKVAAYVMDEMEKAEARQQASAKNDNTRGSGLQTADNKALELPAPLNNGYDLVLRRKGYTVSYNARTMQPNWVAWQLTPERMKGGTDRKNFPFTTDEEVPEPRVEDADYRSSGYDRGHMCPAGDNKWDAEAMRQSFLFSNICPQAPGLNRGDWNEMEKACRKWAEQQGRLYVVCGPIFYKKSRQRTIGRHRIPVPDAFFKVLLCMTGTPRAIGFIYKNTDGNRPKGDYANSVDEVERITGINFFPSLPDEVERKVEAVCDVDSWIGK